jgi:hypothetical protein
MMKWQPIALLIGCGALAGAESVRADAVTEWNATTLSCSQGPPAPANRPGPPGLADIAIVQAAVHDAVQAIQGRFGVYQYDDPAPHASGTPEAAAAAAAYYTLVGLYGADDPCLVAVTDPAVTYGADAGIDVGIAAAAALLPHYRPTMLLPTDPFLGGTGPGEWRPTPGILQGANTHMANSPPFVLESSRQFRPEPPPLLRSLRYARDYDEVKKLGSVDSIHRSAGQTDLARFWSVNFIAQWFSTVRAIADEHVPDIGDKARLLALVALAAADSQHSVYDTKYYYNFWRPSTAINEGDNDGNPKTVGDPAWTPFLANPPYSDYSSGANCLTASITTILQLFFKTDRFEFEVSSTATGLAVNPRAYEKFSQAQQEVVEARILQGIHFRTADEVGRRQGVRVGVWTFGHALRPVSRRKDGWEWHKP